METLQKEINILTDVKLMVQSENFQEYIVKPMREYQNELKDAYDCETLKELYAVKGKKQGSDYFFNILKGIDEDRKAKLVELNASDQE